MKTKQIKLHPTARPIEAQVPTEWELFQEAIQLSAPVRLYPAARPIGIPLPRAIALGLVDLGGGDDEADS